MRTSLLFSIALLTSTASGQELLQEAPLEAIRPRSTPIELKEDPPPPVPRKIIKKKPVTPKLRKVISSGPLPINPPQGPKAAVPANKMTPAPTVAPATPPVLDPKPMAEKPVSPVTARVQKVTTVVAESPTPPHPTKPAKVRGHGGGRRRALLNFRVASIYAMKKSTSSGSFILGWDPVILPYGRYNFGLSLGATRFESEALPSQSAAGFFVYEYGVATSYYVTRNLLPEVVVGMQTWKESNKATTNLFLALNANYLFRRRPMGGHLDRLYAGYGMLNTKNGATHILRAGIGFRF